MHNTIEAEIIKLIKKTLQVLKKSFGSFDIPSIYLEVPKTESHGDLSCSIAMRIAKEAGCSPLQIAEVTVRGIEEHLKNSPLKKTIERVEMQPPGFINFFLSQEFLYDTLMEIRKEKANFGKAYLRKNTSVQIEFVSANPTGSLSVAHGRQAAVGDSLARILSFSGYRVTKEYYINDEGNQIDLLGQSLRVRCYELMGKPTAFPKDGYKGGYIFDIAQAMIDKYGISKFETSSSPLNLVSFSRFAMQWILKSIKKDLKDFGVHFDVWSSQARLRKTNKIEKALRLLKKKGFVYEKDGAWWFASTEFGDDKDRVAVKSDGSFTYITPDIAYHKDKFKRGFKQIIDIWGPDHHGYIPRIKAAVKALGYDEKSLIVLIVQLATLFRGGKPVPMSTRFGEYISLREVIDEVGRDAARFFFLMRRTESHLDFDLELAKKASLDNPVYYVQYAHARICSVLRHTHHPLKKRDEETVNLFLLKEPEALNILRVLFQFPRAVQSSAKNLEPYRMVTYLQDVASGFHRFYERCRVITDNQALSEARLLLVDGVRIVLENGLKLLGVSAPKKMGR